MSLVLHRRAVPFNPALPGTIEAAWREALCGEDHWAPARGPLLVVSPHPDDEVMGAGGLMRMWASWGHRVTVVSVTDGEAAFPDWIDLNLRRQRELAKALVVLSPQPIRTVRLGIEDGRVATRIADLTRTLRALCRDKPTLIAPFEQDGHPDHEAVAQACLAVAEGEGVPIARYPIWAWHHALPSDFDGYRWGRFALDQATRAAKLEAIDCFASQLAPGGQRTPIVPAHVLEYFRRDFEAFLL
jgi:LmbE family N-acetylglucosaminyl deacetylase